MSAITLFRGPLTEQYRPKTWSEVIGQEKIVQRIQALTKRGLAGRAYWISGGRGQGKTTIGRLIAAEVADEICIQEVDASALTVAQLRDLERDMQVRGWGEKGGRAYVVNEAHGLRKTKIRFEKMRPDSP
jgi:replication-associated recombination protein RarA